MIYKNDPLKTSIPILSKSDVTQGKNIKARKKRGKRRREIGKKRSSQLYPAEI